MEHNDRIVAASSRRTLHYLNSKFKASIFDIVSRSQLLSATVGGLNERFLGMTDLMQRVSASLTASLQAFATTFNESRSRMENAKTKFQSIEEDFGATYKLSRELQEEAKRAGERLAVITDITETTSILGLNASIQAARAGSAGKAFAVVAGEIRKHADVTRTTIDQTNESIESMVGKILDLSARMDRIHADVSAEAFAIRDLAALIEKQHSAVVAVQDDVASIEESFADYAAIRTALERMVAQSSVSTKEIERILVSFQRNIRAIEQN
jgi:methyl-accepting chemotaxis protein